MIPVNNTPQQVQALTRICLEKQRISNRRVEDLVSLAALVTAVFTGIILGMALTPLAGVILGLVAYGVASSLFTLLADKLKSRKLEKAVLALNQPDFVQFSNQKQLPLNLDTLIGAHKAYLRFLAQRIKAAGG